MVDIGQREILVPQLPWHRCYPHLGILRCIGGSSKEHNGKIKGKLIGIMQRVRAARFDRSAHVMCASVLKGAMVGYYTAPVGLTWREAEALERPWRAMFTALFRLPRGLPRAKLYGGKSGKVGGTLGARHVMEAAMASLHSTYAKALCGVSEHGARIAVRSALARPRLLTRARHGRGLARETCAPIAAPRDGEPGAAATRTSGGERAQVRSVG